MSLPKEFLYCTSRRARQTHNFCSMSILVWVRTVHSWIDFEIEDAIENAEKIDIW